MRSYAEDRSSWCATGHPAPRVTTSLTPLVAEPAVRELERSGYTGVGWSRVRDG